MPIADDPPDGRAGRSRALAGSLVLAATPTCAAVAKLFVLSHGDANTLAFLLANGNVVAVWLVAAGTTLLAVLVLTPLILGTALVVTAGARSRAAWIRRRLVAGAVAAAVVQTGLLWVTTASPLVVGLGVLIAVLISILLAVEPDTPPLRGAIVSVACILGSAYLLVALASAPVGLPRQVVTTAEDGAVETVVRGYLVSVDDVSLSLILPDGTIEHVTTGAVRQRATCPDEVAAGGLVAVLADQVGPPPPAPALCRDTPR